jgi:hypothetical protein
LIGAVPAFIASFVALIPVLLIAIACITPLLAGPFAGLVGRARPFAAIARGIVLTPSARVAALPVLVARTCLVALRSALRLGGLRSALGLGGLRSALGLGRLGGLAGSPSLARRGAVAGLLAGLRLRGAGRRRAIVLPVVLRLHGGKADG